MKAIGKHFIKIMLLGVVFSVFVANLYPQSGNRIIGMVFNPQRSPVPQVNVELLDEYSRVIGQTRTDSSGRFAFSGMAAGRYYVKVLTFDIGFEEQIKEIEIYNFNRTTRTPSGTTSVTSSNEIIQVDFYLKPPKSDSQDSITGVVFAQEVPADAKNEFDKAIKSLAEKKTDEGISQLEEAIRLFPTYFLALNKLGQEQVTRNKFQEAIETLKKAVEVNPKAYNTWIYLGLAYQSLKEIDESIKALKTSVQLKPTAQGLTLLGISERQNKNYKEAEKNLLQAKKLSKNNVADIHWNLALLYAYNLKEFDNAADELEMFIKARNEKNEAEKIKKLIVLFRKVEKYLKNRPEIRKNESYENIIKIVNNS